MKKFPELNTERLLLRGFSLADKEDVIELAGAREIAAKTLSIPHPLKPEDAEKWLKDKKNSYSKNKEIAWAICARTEGHLMGAIGLSLNDKNDSAELGFWMGKPYWGRGYTTEAGREVLNYAFGQLKLNRVEAYHMTGNNASGRVLEKLGMKYEGLHRQRIKKWEEFKDVKCFAILRSDRL
jgi:RimJ/RimL family protein N-acetyltransferase